MTPDAGGSALQAVSLAAAVNAGEVAPDFGVSRARNAILARNGALNAIVDFDPEAAILQLEALERRLASGETPLLSGVPIAVKDHIEVEGWRVTEGSRLFASRTAGADEPVIRRLRAAGAILVGRTNMSEFGCKGNTTNLLYGATRHPLDPSLTPGGSSGGAAAAVAGGLVPLALASDGGGSVRRPAAHVGAVGFKPSAGAVADPRAFTHTGTFGGIAGTVADARLLFRAIAGPDPRDPLSLALPETKERPDRLRAAWSPRLGLDAPVDADVSAALERAVDTLRRAGLRIDRADPAWPPGASEEALMPLQHAALAAEFGVIWRNEPDLFDPDIGMQIERGLALSGASVASAQAMSLSIARAAAALFAGGFDLVLSPTTPCTAWPVERLGPERIGGVSVGPRAHAVFTPFFNHAFCPAISLPAGAGRDGLPVGLQIAGPRFTDFRVLAFAERAEAILAGDGA